MSRDPTVTQSRILGAAVEEFSRAGLAGARIDRIADLSGFNKRMIYIHFGDKDQLFTAALEKVIGDMMTEVPITEDDLPGYAGALFDYLLVHPAALRMALWRHLERPEVGPDEESIYAEKVAALDRIAAHVGRTQISPIDLLVLIQGMAGAWLISPIDLLSADGSDPAGPARTAAHRSALVEAVARLTSPSNADTT